MSSCFFSDSLRTDSLSVNHVDGVCLMNNMNQFTRIKTKEKTVLEVHWTKYASTSTCDLGLANWQVIKVMYG